ESSAYESHAGIWRICGPEMRQQSHLTLLEGWAYALWTLLLEETSKHTPNTTKAASSKSGWEWTFSCTLLN
ncbi:MAG: hypothetical protein WA869_01915, partial [Alloacidobacterium sp.]